MATKSEYISDAQLEGFRKNIEQLQTLRKEVALANKAGVDLGFKVEDIDSQIASLTLLIKTYSLTGS